MVEHPFNRTDDWKKPRIVEYNPHYDDLTKSAELYGYPPESELATRIQNYLQKDKKDIVQKGVRKFGQHTLSLAIGIDNVPDTEMHGTTFIIGKTPIEKWMDGTKAPEFPNLLRICVMLDARKQLKKAGKTNEEIGEILSQPMFDGENIRQVLRGADTKELGSVHERIDSAIKKQI